MNKYAYIIISILSIAPQTSFCIKQLRPDIHITYRARQQERLREVQEARQKAQSLEQRISQLSSEEQSSTMGLLLVAELDSYNKFIRNNRDPFNRSN